MIGSLICDTCHQVLPRTHSRHRSINSIYDYRDEYVQKLVKHIKEYPNESLVRRLSAPLGLLIGEHIEYATVFQSLKNAILVPIPGSRERLTVNGFNQSLMIADAIKSAIPEIEILPMLEKTRETKKQALLGRNERIQNSMGSMRAVPGYEDRISPQTMIIIVDDISTTGSTLHEARRAIRERYDCVVGLYALAHESPAQKITGL